MSNIFQNTINSAREKFDKSYRTFIKPIQQARQDFSADIRPGGFVGFRPNTQTAQSSRPVAQLAGRVVQDTVQNMGNIVQGAYRGIKSVGQKLNNPYNLSPEQQAATTTPGARMVQAVGSSLFNTGRDFLDGTAGALRSTVDQKQSFTEPYKKMMTSGFKVATLPLAAAQPGITLASGAIGGALNAGLGDKSKANRFETGFGEGVTSAGAYKAIGGLTNPLIDKLTVRLMESKTVLKALDKVPGDRKQQFVKFLAERASVGALNVPEGMVMQGTVRPDLSYTVQDALLDFTAGAAGGKSGTGIGKAFGNDELILKNIQKKDPNFRIIHPEDRQRMLDLINYNANPKYKDGSDQRLELDASRIAERYGLNMGKDIKSLATSFKKTLDSIDDNQYIYRSMKDNYAPKMGIVETSSANTMAQPNFTPLKVKPEEAAREKLGKIMYGDKQADLARKVEEDPFIKSLDDDARIQEFEQIKDTVKRSGNKQNAFLVNQLDAIKQKLDSTITKTGKYQEYLQQEDRVLEKPQLLYTLEGVANDNAAVSRLILDARKSISNSGTLSKSNKNLINDLANRIGGNTYPDDILKAVSELPTGREIREMNVKRVYPDELKKLVADIRLYEKQQKNLERQISDSYTKIKKEVREAPTSPLPDTYTPKEYEKIRAERDLKLPPPPPVKGEAPSFEYVEHLSKGYGGRRPEEKVGLLDWIRTPTKVLEKLGLKKESDLLLRKYDNYLTDHKREIDRVTAWQKQVPDKESAKRIFNHLDGKKLTLSDEELKVAGEIKAYLGVWADKLNLPKDGRLADYITHIFEPDFITKEFDEDIAKLLVDRIPGSVYNPFLQERLGKKGYIEDVWRALDAYVKRATRKFNMDPALNQLKKAAETLDNDSFKYVESYAKRINMQPTQLDNYVDNTIKSVVGYKFGQRPTANLSNKARQMIFRGALGLNLGSAIRNITQGVNTYATLGEKYTAKGYLTLFKKLASNDMKELEDNNILSQNIGMDRKYDAVKGFWEKADKGLFFMFDLAEKINRGSAYFGAKQQGLSKGMNEKDAIQYAKSIVSKTQFNYGSVETPVVLQSDIVKLLAQFQTFGIKQTEFIADMAKRRDVAGGVRFVLATFAISQVFQKMFGLSTNIWDQFGIVGGMAEGTYNTITQKEGPQNQRFQGPPITQIVGATTKVPKAIAGDKYAQEDLKKAVALMIPGGVQAKKTIEGAAAFNRGASETPKGQVRYTIDKNVGNRLRTATMGQYAASEAEPYFKEKRKPYGDQQSALIRELGKPGEQIILDNRLQSATRKQAVEAVTSGDIKKAEELMKGMTLEQRNNIMRSAELDKVKSQFTPEQKALYNLTAEQKEQLIKSNPEYASKLLDMDIKIKSVSKSKSRRVRARRSKRRKLRVRKARRTKLSKRVRIKRPSFA